MAKAKTTKPTDPESEDILIPEDEQPYVIPGNWKWVKLGSIVSINPPKISSKDIPDEQICTFIPMAAVSAETGKIEMPEEKPFAKVKQGFTSFQEGDIIFAKITPCMENGKSAIATELLNGFGYGSTEFHVLRTNQKVITHFIYYLVRSESFREKAKGNMSGSVGQQRVPKDFLLNFPFALPPLPEQKRIVDKLESMLGKINEARELIEQAKDTFKLRRAAILAKAFSGELTEKWREENPDVETGIDLLERIVKLRNTKYEVEIRNNKLEGKKKPRKLFIDNIPFIDYGYKIKIPDTWTYTNIDFISYVTKLAGFEYTEHFKVSESGDIPIIRAQNVQMGEFIEKNIMYISKETSDFLDRSQLYGRELLMVFIGAGTGNVCLAPKDRRWHLGPNVAKIDLDFVNTKFVSYYLQSPIGIKNRSLFTKATAQESLSMETIRKIVVHLPPLEEQHEIVRIVENLLNLEDEAKELIDGMEEELNLLEKSILSKAFRGELGTNNPDEPNPMSKGTATTDNPKQLQLDLA